MNAKLVLSVVGMVWASQSMADPVVDRMRDQLRQTVTQMRQLEDENLALKAKLANASAAPAAPVVKVVTKDNSAELLKLRGNAQREQERASALQKKVDELSQQNQQMQAYITQVKGVLANQQQSVLVLNEKTTLAEKNQKLCEQSNQALVDMSQEILKKYQQQNLWQAMRKHEPLLGLYQVKIDNILQAYQQKIADADVSPIVNDMPENPSSNEQISQ